MKTKRIITAFITALIAFSITVSAQNTPQIRQKTFEKIWQIVNEKFWDPTFGGVDWKASHDRFAPQVTAAKTDSEFYALMAKMLGELKTSHLDIITPETMAKMQQPPVMVGLGCREIDGRIVITRVLENTSAAEAGLKTGFVITKIDGKATATFDNTQALLGGTPNTTLKLSYLDEKDEPHEAQVERRLINDLTKTKVARMNLFALVDSKRVDGNIGYIRFSSFFSSLDSPIKTAVESMHDAPGIIIDLRANSGGEDSVALNLAGLLLDKETQLGITKRRKGDDYGYKAKPSKNPFRGVVVILVDQYSRSQAEAFSAGMQDVGRAIVIGKTTAGGDMDSEAEQLPDGSVMLIALGQPRTPNKGYIAEGRGVKPDIDVSLNRKDLLAGKDSQLEAAIEYIKRNRK